MSTEIKDLIAEGMTMLDRLQRLHSDHNFQDEVDLSAKLSELCNNLKAFPSAELQPYQNEIKVLLDRLTENMSEASETKMQIRQEMVSMRKKNIGAKTYMQNKLVKYL